MAQKVDDKINEVIESCLEVGLTPAVTATQLKNYVNNAQFSVYCDFHVEKTERDPPSNYVRRLWKDGNEHEEQYIQNKYPHAKKLVFDKLEDGFYKCVNEMFNGTEVISNGALIHLGEGMQGKADILVKNVGKSKLWNYHYVVKEIKIAKNIENHHIMQAAFYNHILGKIQGYLPDTFYLINGEGIESDYSFSSYENELKKIIQEMQKIVNGAEVSPTYKSCAQTNWNSYCNNCAIDTNDLTLIPWLGATIKNNLIKENIKTLDDLLAYKDKVDYLVDNIDRMGEKNAPQFLLRAEAIKEDKILSIPSDKVNLPKHSTEIFLDFEGTDEVLRHKGKVHRIEYLIGMIIRKNENEIYKSFIANDINKEKEMLERFLEFLKTQKDYVIYHWGKYEKTNFKKMFDRHAIDKKMVNLVLSSDNLIDLEPETLSRVVFPTYDNTLKTIARKLEFDWRQGDVDAKESIVLYMDYLDDPKKNKKNLQMIEDYNEDDCKATLIIKDWLVKNF